VSVIDVFEMVEIEEDDAALGALGNCPIDDLHETAVEIAIVIELGEFIPFGDLLRALGFDGVDDRKRDGACEYAEKCEISIRVPLPPAVVEELDDADRAALDLERRTHHGLDGKTDPEPRPASEYGVCERFGARVWKARSVHLADDPLVSVKSLFDQILTLGAEAGDDHERSSVGIFRFFQRVIQVDRACIRRKEIIGPFEELAEYSIQIEIGDGGQARLALEEMCQLGAADATYPL